jgi:hypothetical protein
VRTSKHCRLKGNIVTTYFTVQAILVLIVLKDFQEFFLSLKRFDVDFYFSTLQEVNLKERTNRKYVLFSLKR